VWAGQRTSWQKAITKERWSPYVIEKKRQGGKFLEQDILIKVMPTGIYFFQFVHSPY
jgi:hypothetical protein